MKRLDFCQGADFLRELLVIGPIRFYQRNISPNWPSKCRFVPSCSAFAITAVRQFGAFRGMAMACCRILRCNPLCKGGYDPVPNRFSLRPFAAAHQQMRAQAAHKDCDTED
ncbi:MAG: membrane protein insertion efficiency factor YidD [Angelakisella sp.]